MKYVFVKRYNSAYDFFLIRYFKANGIDVDETLDFKRAHTIANALEQKGSVGVVEKPPYRRLFTFRDRLAPQERLFWDYVYDWRGHPESRPAVDYLFDKLFEREPDVKKLAELESQLPPGQGKLLFSDAEAAEDIARFYRRYMRDALKKDLDDGKVGRDLAKYFSYKERKLLPDMRVVGLDKMEEADHRVAGELLEWLNEIAPGSVLHDIQHVLEEHSKDMNHRRLTNFAIFGDPRPTRFCEHRSDYVQLSSYYPVSEGVETMYLQPARGFRVWEKQRWEDDWSNILFPHYEVMRMN